MRERGKQVFCDMALSTILLNEKQMYILPLSPKNWTETAEIIKFLKPMYLGMYNTE